MHINQVYRERVTANNGPHKWWHHRWFKIIGIFVIVLIVFAVILALLLNFVVFAPKKLETSTTAATSLSPQTTATTTTQQPGWSVTGNMNNARYLHTASVLSNGKVLVTGGLGNSGMLNSAELYDPSTGIWTTTSNMSVARFHHTACVLSNEKVLVTGG
ncbi:unnamed protein product [Adineta steineri]|nr:unnamed protein product [Adineta steineri]